MRRKILIATHGSLADGIKSSINILCGEQPQITYLNAYVDDHQDIDQLIHKFFEQLTHEEEVVIFTDIMGGSVNQRFFKFIDKPNVFIIAGFNLAIILDLVIDDKPLSDDILKEKISMAREQLTYLTENKFKKEDDIFFD